MRNLAAVFFVLGWSRDAGMGAWCWVTAHRQGGQHVGVVVTWWSSDPVEPETSSIPTPYWVRVGRQQSKSLPPPFCKH